MSDGSHPDFPVPLWPDDAAARSGPQRYGDPGSVPTWPPRAPAASGDQQEDGVAPWGIPAPSALTPSALTPSALTPSALTPDVPATRPQLGSQRGGWGWAPGRSVSTSGLLEPMESWTSNQGPPHASEAGAGSGIGRHAPDITMLDTLPQPTVRGAASEIALWPTERVPAAHGRRDAGARSQPHMLRTWGIRLALVAVLVALGLRANLNSLPFVSPGGAIIGWTSPPAPTNLFSGVPPVSSTGKVWTPQEYATYLTQHMSLADELGQMIMIQFYASDITPDMSTMIGTYHVGGALLLGRPVQASDKALNAAMQQLAGNQLLVSIDQEGGMVNRFFAVDGPAPAAAMLTTPAAARAQGIHDAQMLAAYGYNFNLAPVVDVGDPNENSQFFGRTFSNDPQQIAPLAGAYLDGLQSTYQVTAVLKHFPGGLEETGQDPHEVMPQLSISRAQWEQTDLAPYRTLLANNDVRAIMVTHEMIPAVDPKYPASLSPAVITDTLRDELDFNGVVISDDLHMKALQTQWTIAEASVLAVKAGTDIVADLATPDEVQQTVAALEQAVASGEITKSHIDTSVERILTLKIRMGLIALPAPAHSQPRRPLPSGPALPQAAYPPRSSDQALAASGSQI